MSSTFERLADLFERGHREPVSGLMSDARFDLNDRTADAAVLIAVTDRKQSAGGPGVILTKRPDTMRDHPGQVAFPGGKIDAGEDAVAAALREAHEELALEPRHVSVIGATDRYQTGTGFEVTPVLAVIPPDLDLTPNLGEVEAWFEAPLDLLLNGDSWTKHEVFWNGAMRQYLEMHYSGFRIWGVTAAIISNLSRRISYEALFGAEAEHRG